MIKTEILASKKYDVVIGNNILKDAGAFIKPFMKTDTAVIVTDDRVAPIYLEKVSDSLKKEGISPLCFIFENGEKSKNGTTYLKLLNFMAEHHICRRDMIIALGGGVCGDLTGFAAATYLRGVPFVQIPTTLLAAVDSSVGGKTAIDLENGKNLAGAFYQPSLVLCDTDTLKTLDEENIKSGMAEVIKYAIIKDKNLYSYLMSDEIDMEKIIDICVKIKSEVVNADEFDTGIRQILNFGHTFGHAIELDSNFSIIHGYAVATGMCIMAKTAYKNGLCSKETADSIIKIIEKYNLPTEYEISKEKLVSHMLSDKKVMGKTINMIVPKEIGVCEILPVETEKLMEFTGE